MFSFTHSFSHSVHPSMSLLDVYWETLNTGVKFIIIFIKILLYCSIHNDTQDLLRNLWFLELPYITLLFFICRNIRMKGWAGGVWLVTLMERIAPLMCSMIPLFYDQERKSRLEKTAVSFSFVLSRKKIIKKQVSHEIFGYQCRSSGYFHLV